MLHWYVCTIIHNEYTHIYTLLYSIQNPFIHIAHSKSITFNKNLFLETRVPMEHYFHSKLYVYIFLLYTCQVTLHMYIYHCTYTHSIFRCSLARINDFLYYRTYTFYSILYTLMMTSMNDPVFWWKSFAEIGRQNMSKIWFVLKGRPFNFNVFLVKN